MRFGLAWTLLLLALAPLPARAEDLVTFDNHEVELRQLNGRWQLLAGKVELKDFGAAEEAGREALQLLRYLRINQHGTIGTPMPVIEYWLTDGAVPQGLTGRLRLLAFDPKDLRVEQVQGQWCLRDDRQLLFTFGGSQQDAQKALETILKFGFNRVGYLGKSVPLMMYFLASTEAPTRQSPIAPGAQAPLRFAPELLRLRQLNMPGLGGSDASSRSERVALDWRQVQIRLEGQSWKLMLGSYVLADLGYNEMEARDVLRLVQYYRITEENRLGTAPGSFQYFLANGQAPVGVMFGVRTIPFRPTALEIRQSGAIWTLCEGQRTILRAGNSREEAEQALKVIQKYQFNNVCTLGYSEATIFNLLVKER